MVRERLERSGESLRVLSVTKSTGGLANCNRILTEQLQAREFRVRVVCLSEGRDAYARSLAEQGVETISMDMARYSISPLSDLALAIRLVRHVRRHPVDLIIGHGAKAGFLGRLAGRAVGVPALYAMYSMPFLRRIQGRWAVPYGWLERVGARLGGHIVAVNHSMRDELVRRGIAQRSAVTVIQQGIDPSPLLVPHDRHAARAELGLDPRRPVIGWAGRMAPQKSPFDFVRAVELVARSVPEAQFFMAGEGALENEVRELVDRLGLGDRLILASWQKDVVRMFAAFDVYVATSRWEGLPLTLLEAMAAERAVVVTPVDGVQEVIRHGVDGFLVAVGDIRAMAGHLEQLLRDEPRRAELARAARARVMERFTVNHMMEHWEDLIERQLAAGV